MWYKGIVHGIFIDRPNRFIANIWVNGERESVHVRNTGRCREILIPGTRVLLEKASNNSKRKTRFSLIGAYKGSRLINIDSQIPNALVFSVLDNNDLNIIKEIKYLKQEVTYQHSRFDLFYRNNHKKGFIEVKGVTLEKNRVALFPDAPTIRGTRHILELIDASKKGYENYIVFVIQMKGVGCFKANDKMDPDFSEALRAADKNGVHIRAYDCLVTNNTIKIDQPIRVVF
ncbi:MAG: DNA/RNA nuclease SfsA [Candidatus Atribacteria bacterium]|nr:MAG: DNA/RNA nuclease SfsA [Candidatus Atribacteria bacterium]